MRWQDPNDHVRIRLSTQGDDCRIFTVDPRDAFGLPLTKVVVWEDVNYQEPQYDLATRLLRVPSGTEISVLDTRTNEVVYTGVVSG